MDDLQPVTRGELRAMWITLRDQLFARMQLPEYQAGHDGIKAVGCSVGDVLWTLADLDSKGGCDDVSGNGTSRSCRDSGLGDLADRNSEADAALVAPATQEQHGHEFVCGGYWAQDGEKHRHMIPDGYTYTPSCGADIEGSTLCECAVEGCGLPFSDSIHKKDCGGVEGHALTDRVGLGASDVSASGTEQRGAEPNNPGAGIKPGPQSLSTAEAGAQSPTPHDEQRGAYRKYRVERLNDPAGKHRECWFYVLDLHHDEFAIPALLAYAKACEARFPQLAADLLAKIGHTVPQQVAGAAPTTLPLDVVAYAPENLPDWIITFDVHKSRMGRFTQPLVTLAQAEACRSAAEAAQRERDEYKEWLGGTFTVTDQLADRAEAAESRIAELERALAQAREDERTSIVEWLRKRADSYFCDTVVRALLSAANDLKSGKRVRGTERKDEI